MTWLASWTENIQGAIKYVMLNPSSKLKGEKDMEKYEKARELKKHIVNIRKDYEGDFEHEEMRIRQRAVALYFIDILALRAGNEKDDDQADTVSSEQKLKRGNINFVLCRWAAVLSGSNMSNSLRRKMEKNMSLSSTSWVKIRSGKLVLLSFFSPVT